MKVVLIGFMGTGKTTVAPILAEKLGLETVEMDELIVAKAGGRSIQEIFKTGGETEFRELEAAVSQDLGDRDNLVISTGGGVVTNKITMNYLIRGAVIVELNASFDTVLKRIDPKLPRPLFRDQAEAKELYEQRKPLYSSYAAIQVITDGKSVNEVVEDTISQINKVKSS
jgi:shikimate kinase